MQLLSMSKDGWKITSILDFLKDKNSLEETIRKRLLVREHHFLILTKRELRQLEKMRGKIFSKEGCLKNNSHFLDFLINEIMGGKMMGPSPIRVAPSIPTQNKSVVGLELFWW